MTGNNILLDVDDLHISFETEMGRISAVKGVSFQLKRGEVLGIVGESGSGKSVSAMSILRLLPMPPASIDSGKITFDGLDLLAMPDDELRKIRGKRIGVIFQEPMTALSPLHHVGKQLVEAQIFHSKDNPEMTKEKAWENSCEWLGKVGIPEPESRMKAYPYEFSGGQRQRVMIAMTLMMEPELIIADEPTTALDVTTQAQIFDLLMDLKSENSAVLFITHDMGVIDELSDRVMVMHRGKVVETGLKSQVIKQPRESYTRELINAVPRLNAALKNNENNDVINHVTDAKALIKIEGLNVWYPVKRGLWRRTVGHVKAVNGIDLNIHQGEILALVGESGCGKTTLGRTILGLEKAVAGRIDFNDRNLCDLNAQQWRPLRAEIQMVFQDPYASLNPRQRVIEMLTEALKIHNRLSGDPEEKALSLLKDVGLDKSHLYRYPHEFSGGQRQRLCLARAISLNPKFIVFDEAVSALDVVVQAQILDLLRDLKSRYKLTYLFITHDLSVVSEFADRVAVMHEGKIVETNTPAKIIGSPQHPYTQALIKAVPSFGR